MLIHPTIDQLRQMKLTGMADALSDQLQDSTVQALSFEERLSFIIDREKQLRSNRQLQTRLRQAKLHCTQASMEDIDYRQNRQLDKKVIARLSAGDWLSAHHNLILTGATGTGKTWLACAFAHKACLLGYRARYWRVARLLEELSLGRSDGRYLSIVKMLAKIDVLILDDWAMVKLQGNSQQDLLDVLDDRYQKRSTIITSQLPVASWYDQIRDKTFADAIMDRMLSQAHKMELKGESLRCREVDKIEKDFPAENKDGQEREKSS